MTTIIGIDPGLVHTGVVVMRFTGDDVTVDYQIYELTDVNCIAPYVGSYPGAHVFIEAYRPRGNTYATDGPMQELMGKLRTWLPKAKVIDNTGMKYAVKAALMQVLGVWKFSTSTHHQDLRSAARIGIYGALKDPVLNAVLFKHVVHKI